jgi:hypothetical protein
MGDLLLLADQALGKSLSHPDVRARFERDLMQVSLSRP